MKPLKIFVTITLVAILFSVTSNAFAKSTFEKLMDFNRQGVECFNKGDFEQAIKHFNKALNLNSNGDAVTLTNLGAVCLKMGNRDEAAKFFDEAVDANPEYANAWNMRGVMYFRESIFDKARENFQKAHKLFPDNKTILNNLAQVYLKSDNRNAADWRQLGAAYEHLKDFDKAADCYNKALELEQGNAVSWSSLAGLYYRMKNYDKAIDCCNKALTLAPTDSVIRQNLAFAYLRAENYTLAAQNFSKALEFAPNNANSHYGLGVAYQKLGDLDNAETSLKKASELSPKSAAVWQALGDVYFAKKDYVKAIEQFNKASELDPKNAETYTKLAETYEALNEIYKAAYEEAKATAITDEDKLKASKIRLLATKCRSAAAEFRLKATTTEFNNADAKGALVMITASVSNFRFYEINFLED